MGYGEVSEEQRYLEGMVAKYTLPYAQYEFLEEQNRPTNELEVTKLICENDKVLDTLCCALLKLDRYNPYAHLGMHMLEKIRGDPDRAIRHALVGIKHNPYEEATYTLRASLAKFYEFLGRYKESNEVYFENINFSIDELKEKIYDFCENIQTRYSFVHNKAQIVISEETQRNPLGLGYIANDEAIVSLIQSKENHLNYQKAIQLHEQENYLEANKLLFEVDSNFAENGEDVFNKLNLFEKKISNLFFCEMTSNLNRLKN
jgi:hypothetical protein